MVTILNSELESQRKGWISLAKKYGWYTEPFYIQVWVKDGSIIDSVSVRGMDKDYIVDADTEEVITEYKLV